MAAQFGDQGLGHMLAVRRDLAQRIKRKAVAQAFKERIDLFRVARVRPAVAALLDSICQRGAQSGAIDRIRAKRRLRTRRGDGVKKAQMVGRGFAQADAAEAGLFHGGDLHAFGVVELEAGREGMRRAAFQSYTRRSRLAGVGAQAQASDLGRHVGNAKMHRQVVPEQLDDELESTIQQGGVQARGVEFASKAGVRFQHGERAGVGFQPPMFHCLKARAVVQAYRTRQRVVALAGEIGRTLGQQQRQLRKARQAGLAQQAAAGVLDPGLGAAGVFGSDAEAAVAVIEQEARDLAGRGVEQQRRMDLEFFEFGAVAVLPAKRGRQGDFGEARAGENDCVADNVVSQHRVGLRIQLVFPGVLMLLHGVAQQRVNLAAREQAEGFGGNGMPVAFALPGVGRQLDRRPGPGEQRLQVQMAAADDNLAGGVPDLFGIVSAASGGAQHAALLVRGLEGVIEIRTQYRMGADFNIDIVAFGGQLVCGLLEANGQAHVAPPVVGGQLRAVQERARDRGIKRHGARARLDVRQRLADSGFDAIHRRTMEGVIQIQAAMEQRLFRQRCLEHVQGFGRSGDGGAAAAVEAGHAQVGAELVFRNDRQGFFAVDADGGHAALAPGLALQAATLEDDANRVGQGQRATRPGGGHFADAMADHRGRHDAALRQHAGDADLQGEQRRLGDFGAHIAVVAVFSGEFLAQREVGIAGEQRVHFIDGCREDGIRKQAASHVGPLRAIAGIDEHRAASGGQGAALDDAGFSVAALCKLLQQVGDGVALGAEDHGALVVPVAAHGGVVRGVVQELGGLVAQGLGHQAGCVFQGLGGLARDHDGNRRGLCHLAFGGRTCGRGALEDYVSVGAAKAERVHAHHQLAAGTQLAVLGDDVQVPVLELDFGVEGLDADGGRHFPMPQHVERLDQPGHARSGLQVAQIALYRADGQGSLLAAGLAQRQPDRARFDRIADRGARAVRFEVVDIRGRNAGLFVGLAHQGGLGVDAGDGQAGLAAVRIDSGTSDHGQDIVAVGDGLVIILQQEHATAFGTHVAIARRIENIAAAARRQHGRLGEGDESVRMQVQADSARQRLGAFTGNDCAACLVECDQGRRAGRVHGDARSAQVEEVRQPVRGDAGGVAGRHGGVDGAQVFGHAVGVVGTGDTDIDAAIGATQGGRRDACIFHGFPAHFQQQALLRIHQGRFTRGNAEEPGVEAGDISNRTRGEGIGGAGMLFGGVQVRVAGPAVLGDLCHQVAAFKQSWPVAVIGGAGESERKSDNGNALTHAVSF